MTDTAVLHIALQAMIISAKLALPILLVSLVIGLGVSIFQSVTQVQEATLSFEGRDLRFPPRIGAELEFLAASEGPFTLADLPGRLDDAGRLVLGRRLVREGFLRISPE